MLKDLFKDRRIQFLLFCFIFLGLLPLQFKGLQFGMDFKGGSLIEVKLDRKLDMSEMQTVIIVLQNRLNAYGLKDIAVRPWGQEYIVVEIAETDPQAVNQLQSLVGQQGKFETLFNGKVVLTGRDIVSVITNPQQGYGVRSAGAVYEWVVPFLLSTEGAQSFSDDVAGQCTPLPNSESCAEQVYMFIDRPENAVILMNATAYDSERRIPDDFDKSPNTISIDELVANSGAELVVSNYLDNETLQKIQNKTVVIAPATFNESILEEHALKVIIRQKIKKYWVVNALNLENIVHLTPSVTAGTPVTQPTITGRADSNQQAVQEMNRVVILLKSGKLPVSVSIGSLSTVSPILGPEFLKFSLIAGLIAILVVATVLFLRYKKIRIAFPIMLTCFFEVVIILGVAALIGWQIDLPSVAGVIVVIGTGVDAQIIIADEVLRKEEEEKMLSIASKIKKAFSIIFMAGGTTIFAMIPLLFMGMGVLKGFALVTILGVLIGLFITRPAYAAIVDKLVKI